MDVLYADAFYSSLFFFLGCIFLFLEVFIPSGGILGILAFASAAFGIFGFFYQDSILLGVASVAGFLAYGALIIFFVLKRVSFKGEVSSETSSSVDEDIDSSLVDMEGVTLTPLRPAGMASINGRKVDVVSIGAFIGKDVRVRVVEVSGNRVVVREM